MNISNNAIKSGTLLSLLMVSDKKGRHEWAIFTGVAKIDDGKLWLDLGLNKPLFEILPEWYCHIKKVPANVKSTLRGADYYLPIVVENMPEDDEGFLRWHGPKLTF
jgi:hypothetical protein